MQDHGSNKMSTTVHHALSIPVNIMNRSSTFERGLNSIGSHVFRRTLSQTIFETIVEWFLLKNSTH